MLNVELPIRTWSEPNMRVHWAKRARRAKQQRATARAFVRARLPELPCNTGPRLTITLTRIGPRLLDSDNLTGALKAVRDGVADALGMDDGDPRLVWRYEQRQGKPRAYAIWVDIE